MYIYEKDFLEPIVKESFNFTEVANKLESITGKPKSPVYVARKIRLHNIDTNHFRRGYAKRGKAKPLEELLKKGVHTQSRNLKR